MARSRSSTLSPRDLAYSLGVSESTVKRWIDAGRLPARRTAGGHRRVELDAVLRELITGAELPDAVEHGLPAEDREALLDLEALHERVHALLHDGRGPALERLLLAALASRRIEPAELYDGPVRSAMVRIGEEWRGGLEGIFAEHRATQILLRILDRIDGLFPDPGDRTIAVGGSLSRDPGLLPTRMAASVLAHAGVHAVDLGASTPSASLLEAVDQLRAGLVWVSVGFVADDRDAAQELAGLATALARRGVPCMVGGRGLEQLPLPDVPGLQRGKSMRDLVRLAAALPSG